MKICVAGDGAWGTALALTLLHNGHRVVVWGAFPDYLDEMRTTRENYRFLPGVRLPDTLEFSSDMSVALADADMVLLSTPTQYLRPVLKQICGNFAPDSVFVNVAKGIEVGSWKRIREIVADELGRVTFVDLSGPSHAEEVSRNVPTAVVAASEDINAAETVQSVFMNEFFRVYTSDDVTGVELGGAIKNVMAIAAGIIDGMGLGDNSKAAMMTRGIAEMSRLGEALGGRRSTFSGLSGIGDLIVTCTSGHSRNRHVGEELGRGRQLDAIIKSMNMVVAEGVATARGAYELARQVKVDTPIIDEVYNVIYNNSSAVAAVRSLMNRKARQEND